MMSVLERPETPLNAPPARDDEDSRLALDAAAGSREALVELLRRHQRWVFAIALRMVRDPNDAADLAQEALVRLVTRIVQFEGRSTFRTWAYRIVVTTVLASRRRRDEELFSSAAAFGAALDALPSSDAEPDLDGHPAAAILAREVQSSCMLGMLLCLDREQRIAFVIADVLGAPSEIGAEILQISAEALRKRLERARVDLASFMNGRCGLVDPQNACRCPRKARALVLEGWVDPTHLRFVDSRVAPLRADTAVFTRRLRVLHDEGRAALFRSHAAPDGPDFAASLDTLLTDPATRAFLRLS